MAILTTLEQIEQNGVLLTLGGTQGPPGARGDYPQAPISTTAAAPVLDCADSAYFRIEADTNFTLPLPLNAVDGQRVMIEITQDAVGGRVLTMDPGYNTAAFTVVLSSDAYAIDLLGVSYHEPTDQWLVLAFSRGY